MAPWTCLVLLLALCLTDPLRAQTSPIYAPVGGKLTLKPEPPISEVVTRIVWKRPEQLVAELRGDDFIYYGSYGSRTTLALDGRLDISDARLNDTVSFTLEVNNRIVPGEYNAAVIGKVPRPTARFRPVSCTKHLDNCTVVCDGDTKDAEPVTITWLFDGKRKDQSKEIVIGGKDSDVQVISCEMTNPVSEERSESKDNPFYKSPTPIILGVLIPVLCVLAAAAGFAFTKRDAIKDRFFMTHNTTNGGRGVKNEPTDAALLPTGHNVMVSPAAKPEEMVSPAVKPEDTVPI